jgi:acetylornithine deacetylase
VDEEYGFSGARKMAARWQQGDEFLAALPDAVVVAEPTQLDVVVAHKGALRWRCRTRGRAAHSSQPQSGHNAIYAMARVVSALERYADEIVPDLADHPLLGRPTLSVGRISGGISVNVVPDECSIEVDRRFLPCEDPQSAWKHAADFVTGHCGGEVDFLPPEAQQIVPAMDRELNGSLARHVAFAARQCGGPGRSIGVPYGTDAPAFVAAGIPTVVFGPGDIQQAHTMDEWVAIDQLHAAVESYYLLAATWAKTEEIKTHPA